MESKALKPCPFCGGPGDVRRYVENCRGKPVLSFRVSCIRCECEVGARYDQCGEAYGAFSFENEAIAAWNLRADTPALAALREERDRLRVVQERAEKLIAKIEEAERKPIEAVKVGSNLGSYVTIRPVSIDTPIELVELKDELARARATRKEPPNAE